MIIQLILLIAISIVVVIWPGFFAYLLHGLHQSYAYLTHGLGLIFSHSHIGQLIQSTLALLIIPLLIGIICAIGMKIFQKKKISFTMRIVWVVWMLLIATIVLI